MKLTVAIILLLVITACTTTISNDNTYNIEGYILKEYVITRNLQQYHIFVIVDESNKIVSGTSSIYNHGKDSKYITSLFVPNKGNNHKSLQEAVRKVERLQVQELGSSN